VPPYDAITDVPGLKVGHWTDLDAVTGCTVVLCEAGAVGSVDVRGGAPGTHETDLLRPGTQVQQVHAIVLAGGSAFGLQAAAGVMRWCEQHGIGFAFGGSLIPIVPAAIIFDLGIGRGDLRPDADAGYAATGAVRDGPVEQGSIGVGTGATVAKVAGMSLAIKGGLGSASESLASGLVVGALVAVNAGGEIVDSITGRVIAGPRGEPGAFLDTLALLRQRGSPPPAPENTTIGVVATNARLNKEQAYRLAATAHDGLARAIRPVHTLGDGDTIFSLATGEVELASPRDQVALEALGALAVERAILKAVLGARSLAGVPSAREWLSRSS
jgi:L-aminopeptidase/D-esterase-like protein